MPFNAGAIANVIMKVDACVVNQDVERSDVRDSSLNLRRVSYVEDQRHDARIRMCKELSRPGIHALRASFQGFLKQGPPDAAIGASNQNCFVFDYIHITVLRADSVNPHECDAHVKDAARY